MTTNTENVVNVLPRTPSFRLDGRRAVVSGGGRGIGAAIAVALATAGAEVWLAARSASQVEEVSEGIRISGYKATAITLDVMDCQAVNSVFERLPGMDILVNCAGTNRPKPIGSVTLDDYYAVFDLNVGASYFVAQAFLRKPLAEKRPASIINMSSQMGHVGAANRTLYCASKHAVEGLTKAMAVELASCGIRVNSIAPTFIETPMTRPFLADDSFRHSVLTKIKLGRMGKVEDVMGAAVFLASDASALITGTSLVVDGGWTAE